MQLWMVVSVIYYVLINLRFRGIPIIFIHIHTYICVLSMHYIQRPWQIKLPILTSFTFKLSSYANTCVDNRTNIYLVKRNFEPTIKKHMHVLLTWISFRLSTILLMLCTIIVIQHAYIYIYKGTCVYCMSKWQKRP